MPVSLYCVWLDLPLPRRRPLISLPAANRVFGGLLVADLSRLRVIGGRDFERDERPERVDRAVSAFGVPGSGCQPITAATSFLHVV